MNFMIFHILGIIISPTEELIFFRGIETRNRRWDASDHRGQTCFLFEILRPDPGRSTASGPFRTGADAAMPDPV